MSKSAPKMVLVVRRDLKMRQGKAAAQCGHAVQEALLDRSSGAPVLKSDPVIAEWLASNYAKVTTRVESEEELLSLYQQALDAGINAHLVCDSGKTEFHGVPTYTVIALGPAYPEDLDPITGHLALL